MRLKALNQLQLLNWLTEVNGNLKTSILRKNSTFYWM